MCCCRVVSVHPSYLPDVLLQGHDIDELEMELLYNRLLQFAFMDIVVKLLLLSQHFRQD
jgi:hypothetical protein